MNTAREWRAAALLLAAYFFLATQFLAGILHHHEHLGVGIDGRIVLCSAASVEAGAPTDDMGRPASLLHCHCDEGLCSTPNIGVADHPDPPTPPRATLRLSIQAPLGLDVTAIAHRLVAHRQPPSRAPPA